DTFSHSIRSGGLGLIKGQKSVFVFGALLRRKLEHFHEIADGGHIAWYIGILVIRHRVREVVAAAGGQGRQAPIALDELEDRHVIVIGVHHPPTPRMRRNCKQWHPRSVAEEVERLDEARVIETAGFVKDDENRGLGKQPRCRLDPLKDVLQESLEEIDFGRQRMAIDQSAGLYER